MGGSWWSPSGVLLKETFNVGFEILGWKLLTESVEEEEEEELVEARREECGGVGGRGGGRGGRKEG